MKSIKVFVCAVALLAMLSSGLLAAGNGELMVKLNSGWYNDKLMRCSRTYVDIWILNDAPLYGISVGFELSMPSDTFMFVEPYGSLPPEEPILEIIPGPGHETAFDLSLEVYRDGNRIFIEGVAADQPLSIHTYRSHLYRLQITTDGGQDLINGFCVDNIPHYTSGKWMFKDVAEYSPTFNGVANNSIIDPSAPPYCFEVFTLPCGYPTFTSTPTLPINMGLCDTFTFDFGAFHLCPFYFESSSGLINTYTGVYQLPPNGLAGPQVDTISLLADGACGSQDFILTIDRTNSAPTIAACKPIMRVQMGTSREIHHQITDPDACDSHSWSVELASGTPPVFSVSAPSLGVVEVDATAVSDTSTFEYQLGALDASGLADTCMSQLKIVAFKPGDANDDGLISISDVVYIIPWIFQAGEIPEPFRSRIDADGNGYPSISDAVYLINYIFIGGPEPC